MPSRMRRRLSSFQFALPRGERPATGTPRAIPGLFQFALPRGERREAGNTVHGNVGFQFALPRGERLNLLL